MKKTVRVLMMSWGPVLQSCGNLVDNSGNLTKYGSKWGRKWAYDSAGLQIGTRANTALF